MASACRKSSFSARASPGNLEIRCKGTAFFAHIKGHNDLELTYIDLKLTYRPTRHKKATSKGRSHVFFCVIDDG